MAPCAGDSDDYGAIGSLPPSPSSGLPIRYNLYDTVPPCNALTAPIVKMPAAAIVAAKAGDQRDCQSGLYPRLSSCWLMPPYRGSSTAIPDMSNDAATGHSLAPLWNDARRPYRGGMDATTRVLGIRQVAGSPARLGPILYKTNFSKPFLLVLFVIGILVIAPIHSFPDCNHCP